MTKNSQFHNPYKGCINTARLIVDIDEADYNLIKTVRVSSGTITGTLGLLIQKLCYELRQRNITDYTKCDEFEDFVANCAIVGGLQHSATDRPMPETSGADDRQRIAPMGGSTAPTTNELPVVQGSSQPKQGGKRMAKGGKKGH